MSAAERELNRHGGASEARADAFHGALEARAVAIEFVDDDGARKLELLGDGPHFLGMGLDAGDGVNDDDGGVGGDERGAGVVHEHVEPGGVEDIDFGLFPLDGGERGGDGQFTLNLFLVVIGNGIAFVNARQAARGARRVEEPGHHGGLPAVTVTYNAYVSDVLRLVIFHGFLGLRGDRITVETWRGIDHNLKLGSGVRLIPFGYAWGC